ncbi:MAG: 6-bladed beta-propeller [Gemmatimonadaceae bacterium]|nr:6-bladed beta-propeller [Gemmatimonadaceae bacterium]
MKWQTALMMGALAPLLVLVSEAEAQRRVEINATTRCNACAVELKTVATLQGAGAPASFPALVRLARNSKGWYAASASTFVGELFVFSADGRFRSAVGRRGEGPGEFAREQLLMFDAHDSLHAIAMGGGRYSVLEPSLNRVARSSAITARVMDARLAGNGRFFALAPTVAATGSYVLQVLGSDGGRVLSFDEVPPGASGQLALGRALAIDAQGGLWSGAFGAYHLRSWDAGGRLRLEAVGRRSWFQPSSSDPSAARRTGLPVQLGGIEFDEEGLLWLFFLIPTIQGDASSSSRAGPGPVSFSTVIEVLDPRDMQLLATGRYPRLLLPFQRGLAYSVEDAPSGETDVRIVSLRLRK